MTDQTALAKLEQTWRERARALCRKADAWVGPQVRNMADRAECYDRCADELSALAREGTAAEGVNCACGVALEGYAKPGDQCYKCATAAEGPAQSSYGGVAVEGHEPVRQTATGAPGTEQRQAESGQARSLRPSASRERAGGRD